MEERISINDEMVVGIDKCRGRTRITVYDYINGSTILSDLETGEYFASSVRFNEYYIVAYSRGCMINQIPLSIDAAYSIKDRRLLDLSNPKLKTLLAYMVVYSKGFDLTHVLTVLNSSKLNLVSPEEEWRLIHFLTSGNESISRQDVIEYILKRYPKLREYTKLKDPISVFQYKSIVEKLEEETFYFNKMPQDLLKLPGITG